MKSYKYYFYKIKRFIFGNYVDKDNLINFYNHFNYDRIIVFDTETTGLDIENDDIIQIAGVEIKNGKIGNSIMFFLFTDRLKKYKQVHNISQKIIDTNGVKPKYGLSEFLEFIKDDPIVAHNIKFDFNMLNSNLKRVGLKPIFKNKLFCSLKMTRQVFPKLKSYKLQNILNTLKVEGVNSHDALDDTKATVNLLFKLSENIEKKFIDKKGV